MPRRSGQNHYFRLNTVTKAWLRFDDLVLRRTKHKPFTWCFVAFVSTLGSLLCVSIYVDTLDSRFLIPTFICVLTSVLLWVRAYRSWQQNKVGARNKEH